MTGTLHGGRLIRSSAENQTETINALPIGAVTAWMGNEIPKDFLAFKEVSYPVNRAIYPEFVDAVWCGDAYNLRADFFYRTADEAGLIRSDSGDWLWMPIGDLYFMRGRDASGTKHPYQYEDWAIENITGTVGSIAGDGFEIGSATGAFEESTNFGARSSPSVTGRYFRSPMFDASRVVKTDTETRPMNFPVKWIIRAANSTSSQNGIDVVALKSKVDGLEAIISDMENGTGLPTGSYFWWGGREDSIPLYAMNLSTSQQQTIPVSQHEGFVNKVWTGAADNDTAAYYYRCDSVDGTARNPAGQYLAMPTENMLGKEGSISTILYPNGGTAEAPANISSNQRLTMDNPYPGYYINCEAQILHNGSWANPEWYTDDANGARARGVRSNQYNDQIIIQSGSINVGSTPAATGSPHQTTTDLNNLPVRVIVTRLGKIGEAPVHGRLCVKLFDGVNNADMLDIQALIEAANNNSVPLGTIMESGGTQADPGYIKCIDSMQYYPISQAPELFNKVWVGEAANDTAEYFYRCSFDGVRNLDGTHFAIPSDLQIRKSGNPTTIIDVGSVDNSQRLIFSNPYLGYLVHCEAQMQFNDAWGKTGWGTAPTNSSYGISAGQLLPDDDIVFLSGTVGISAGGNFGGGVHTSGTNTIAPPRDCRIIVTRLGKIGVPPTFYQIKAWGAPVNQGLADMSRIQGQIAEQNNHLVTSTIIYPNGGTAQAPANVTVNQRIVMDNPYPGYYVQCEAQVLYDSNWGKPGFQYCQDVSNGVDAGQILPGGEVVIQTGYNYVTMQSRFSGNPLGIPPVNLTSLPCRVLVTRLGKIR